VRGLIVLVSAHTWPALRPTRMPSGPSATVSTTASSGSEVKTMAVASATSRGVSRQCSPCSTSQRAAGSRRAVPKTS
jgi:alcohol dehydrogenase class IV